MAYIYNFYSTDHLGVRESYHVKTRLPIHSVRAILMEYRRADREQTLETFMDFMQEEFPEDFKLFDFDDVIQFDADQENSTILANLTDEMNKSI